MKIARGRRVRRNERRAALRQVAGVWAESIRGIGATAWEFIGPGDDPCAKADPLVIDHYRGVIAAALLDSDPRRVFVIGPDGGYEVGADDVLQPQSPIRRRGKRRGKPFRWFA